jgi:hypothetical protein
VTNQELVLCVLAGQAEGYRIHPEAAAFAACGFTSGDQVTVYLQQLEQEGYAASDTDGWYVTDTGKAAAPTTDVGTPVEPPPATPQQQVIVALDALDPSTASVADVIGAVKDALGG